MLTVVKAHWWRRGHTMRRHQREAADVVRLLVAGVEPDAAIERLGLGFYAQEDR